MRTIGAAVLGFGTVGSGVADCLLRRRAEIRARAGVDVELVRVADPDTARDRGVALPAGVLTADAREAIADPRTDIVVETIGGTGVAKALVLEAIAAGKPVATANKKLLAECGAEIFGAAERAGVDLCFGAAVGGGIPIVRVVRDALAANSFRSIAGVLNGTCNYILTQMEKTGASFADALADAQRLGFAEADPSLDIDGWDTAHKTCILARIAFGLDVKPRDIEVEGIRGVTAQDVAAAARAGRRIKLVGRVERAPDGGAKAFVGPVALGRSEFLAGIDGEFNAVVVESDPAGTTAYAGRGAGRDPTASTVAADVCEIARNIARGVTRQAAAKGGAGK